MPVPNYFVRSKENTPGNHMDKYTAFQLKLEEANANRQPCLACDRIDNDWPERRGLCIDCYCAVTHCLPMPADGSREDLFMRMTRREIITIAMYYHKIERERHRLQALRGKLIVDVPQQSGFGEVQRIINKYKE